MPDTPSYSPMPVGFIQNTSLSSAAAIGTIPAGARQVIIQCQGQQVRWRDDGTNPTATVGILMNPGDILRYDGAKLGALKFIEVAASATINASFYS